MSASFSCPERRFLVTTNMFRPCLLSPKSLTKNAIKKWIYRHRFSELFVSGKAYICRKNVNLAARAASRVTFKCGDRTVLRMKCGKSAQEAGALRPERWVDASQGEDEEALSRVKEQPLGIGFRGLTCGDQSAEQGESACVGWEVTAWPGGEESAHHAGRGNRDTPFQHKEASGDCTENESTDMNAGQRTESRGQDNGAELQQADIGILKLHPAGYDIVEELHMQNVDLHSAGHDFVEEVHNQKPPEQYFGAKDNGMASVGFGNSAVDKTQESGEVWLDGLQQIHRAKSSSGVEVENVSVNTFQTKTISEDFHEGKLAKSMNNLVTQVFDDPQGKVDEDARPNDQNELHRGKEPLDSLSDKCSAAESLSQYPVPLSPLSGEAARTIEYERALVAESASNSGPAMTRSGVLFEDEWLLVLNKPCGVYSEHVLATVPSLVTPSASPTFSLSSLTLQLPVHNKEVSSPHFHMANRLDRDTSGVMVVTKSKRAAGKMSNIFTKRQVQKSYIALCSAQRPSWKRLTIESGHGRSRFGAWRVYSKKDVGRGLPGGSVVRDMITRLEVVSINKHTRCDFSDDQRVPEEIDEIAEHIVVGDGTSPGIFQGSPYDLVGRSEESLGEETPPSEAGDVVVRAIPMTGRTHQIRLHCQFVGLSLKGDVKYGGSHIQSGVRYDHHFLHAETLSFKHPFTFEELQFLAPYPQWALDAGVQPSVS